MADPLAEGVYRWRVIAQDEALNTNPSEEGPSFRVDIQVAAAVLLRPPRFVGDRTPLFQWSHAGDETQPVTFTIQVIKTGDDFENGPFAINRDDLGTDLTFEPDDPLDVFDEQDYL